MDSRQRSACARLLSFAPRFPTFRTQAEIGGGAGTSYWQPESVWKSRRDTQLCSVPRSCERRAWQWRFGLGAQRQDSAINLVAATEHVQRSRTINGVWSVGWAIELLETHSEKRNSNILWLWNEKCSVAISKCHMDGARCGQNWKLIRKKG